LAEDIHVLAIEGPAGSGKSTLVRELVARGYVQPPSDYPRPREYVGIEGQRLSLLKDYNSLAFIATSTAPRVVLDRFLLSAFIYEFIRANRADPHPLKMDPAALVEGFECWASILDASSALLDSWGSNTARTGKVSWLVYVPADETLHARRLHASREEGREYPFEAAAEAALYREAFYQLKDKVCPPEGWTFDFQLVTNAEKVYDALR